MSPPTKPQAPLVRDTSITVRANKALHAQFARAIKDHPTLSQGDIFERAMLAAVKRYTTKRK